MSRYTVKTNYCKCHPETCCCDDYVVYKPDGSKYSTFFSLQIAEDVCELLNKELEEEGE